jgi:hypothetical protein
MQCLIAFSQKMFFHIVSRDVCYCSQGRAGSWEGWYFIVWLLCQWPDISSHSWHLEFYNTFATTIRLFLFLTFSAICMFLTSPQTLWPTYGAIFLVFYQLLFLAGCSLGFLSGRRSADDGTSGKPIFRLFNRETVDDIPTTLPRQLTPRRQNVCIY